MPQAGGAGRRHQPFGNCEREGTAEAQPQGHLHTYPIVLHLPPAEERQESQAAGPRTLPSLAGTCPARKEGTRLAHDPGSVEHGAPRSRDRNPSVTRLMLLDHSKIAT